ncbi:hypothetical protein SAMN05519226_0269 [Cycloclasticus pugetii]|nr:hypothetical protein SAMN05519226_0269 [Cycloclasticus pugetii]
MPLTNIKIKNAKPRIKSDGSTTTKICRFSGKKGLHLEVGLNSCRKLY